MLIEMERFDPSRGNGAVPPDRSLETRLASGLGSSWSTSDPFARERESFTAAFRFKMGVPQHVTGSNQPAARIRDEARQLRRLHWAAARQTSSPVPERRTASP
jgi:hypothetical protein